MNPVTEQAAVHLDERPARVVEHAAQLAAGHGRPLAYATTPLEEGNLL
ncbi:hypothetical protein ACH4TQ_12545 [Streptomyces sp. NPDC021218]